MHDLNDPLTQLLQTNACNVGNNSQLFLEKRQQTTGILRSGDCRCRSIHHVRCIQSLRDQEIVRMIDGWKRAQKRGLSWTLRIFRKV